MKNKLIPFLMVLLTVFGSCMKDDIEDLQNQINNLNEKVDGIEASQRETLLKEIETLQAQIESLKSTNTNLSSQYEALLANLQSLEAEVKDNESTVFYGNVLTDGDFAALVAQGATIVTGKVIALSQEHINALALVKMVGGSLTIKSGSPVSLTALTNVGGDLVISDLSTADVTVVLPELTAIGGSLEITNNPALVSFTTNKLILINNDLKVSLNALLSSLSLTALDRVNNIDIDGSTIGAYDSQELGELQTIDLSATNAKGNVSIQYIKGGSLQLGTIGGDFTCVYTLLSDISINSEIIPGSFILQYNGGLGGTNNFSSIKHIGGELNISFNNNQWPEMEVAKMTAMPAFEALEYIGGNVSINTNNNLMTIVAFNNVTEVKGSSIAFMSNGNFQNEQISVFNALTTTGTSSYSFASISIFENTGWFSGFAALEKAQDVTITLSSRMDPSTYEAYGDVRLDGFDALTDVNALTMYIVQATAFNAFSALNNFKSYGTYLSIDMPSDTSVGMCSMSPVLTKVKNGDFDVTWNENKKAILRYNGSEMDRTQAVDQLLATCN